MRKIYAVLVAAMLVVSNVTLFAGEVAAETADAAASSGGDIKALLAQLGVIALEIFTPLLMALGSWAAYKLAQKFGVDLNAAEKAMVEEYIERAIQAVEKWAKGLEEKPSKSDKLAKAIDYANTFLATSGLKKKSSEYLCGLIEARLQAYDEEASKDK